MPKYLCECCNKGFNKLSNFKDHTNKKFTCIIKDNNIKNINVTSTQQLKTNTQLNTHNTQTNTHNTQTNTQTNTHNTQTNTQLNTHNTQHTESNILPVSVVKKRIVKKIHKCENCDITFSRVDALTRHKKKFCKGIQEDNTSKTDDNIEINENTQKTLNILMKQNEQLLHLCTFKTPTF
jgi:hypothetical protein